MLVIALLRCRPSSLAGLSLFGDGPAPLVVGHVLDVCLRAAGQWHPLTQVLERLSRTGVETK